MKKRIFSIALALVFACMPLTGVYAAPQTVEVETAEEADLQSENTQDEASLSALQKLPTPTDLRWNEDWSEHSMYDTDVPEKYYGFISWNVVPDAEGVYDIYAYRNGEKVFFTSWGGLYDDDGNGRVGVSLSDEDIFSQNGSFTFKVVAVGDEMRYSNSSPATSGVYNFTAPSKKLDTPQNVRISGTTIIHSGVHNTSGYKYTFYDQNFNVLGTN